MLRGNQFRRHEKCSTIWKSKSHRGTTAESPFWLVLPSPTAVEVNVHEATQCPRLDGLGSRLGRRWEPAGRSDYRVRGRGLLRHACSWCRYAHPLLRNKHLQRLPRSDPKHWG